MAFDINEPVVKREDVLLLPDGDFNINNICIVTGAASGIGRASAIAAATNGLMAVGLDIDEKGGKLTQDMARELGGQMIFIGTDLTKDGDIHTSSIPCLLQRITSPSPSRRSPTAFSRKWLTWGACRA
jgi:hypothetical protein